MTKQVITTPSGERLVILAEAEYNALVEATEDAEDLAALHEFDRRLAAGKGELFPSGIADRLIDGENPVRVFREYRGFSARELAAKAGISAPYLSEIERGLKSPSVATIKRLAAALDLSPGDLL